MIDIFAWACAAIGAAGLLIELRNLRWFPSLQPQGPSGAPADVLACVAMRDEAHNVRGCLELLLAQPRIAAVSVCDDGSQDGTHDKLLAFASADPCVRLTARTPGGSKPQALALAVQNARDIPYRYLLFTDADVRFREGSVEALAAHLQSEGVRAVTAWPRTTSRTFFGALLSPMTTLLLLQVLPMWRSRGSDDRFAAGNGQIFFIERDAYQACGTHAAIHAVVEDVALARALIKAGTPAALAAAPRIARAFGYKSLQANVLGLGRSLYAGAGTAGCVAFALWQLCAYVAPFASIGVARTPAIAGVTIALISRALQAHRTGGNLAAVLLTPLGAALASAGAIYAALLGASGTLRWRRQAVRS